MFSTSTSLIESLNLIRDVGKAVTIIFISSVLTVIAGLAALGWAIGRIKRHITSIGWDRSGRIGGFYYWRKPWKGYHRFHSRKWNADHFS